MLYWLVGSRELDGGLMCTASHNPKAYTGAKLVRRGALALSGDAGIQDIRRLIEAGIPASGAPPGKLRGRSTSTAGVPGGRAGVHRPGGGEAAAASSSTAATGWPGRWSGRCSSDSGSTWSTTYWEPDGNFPDHEPNPLLPENRAFIMRKVAEERADLGIAWDGDADRCFFIDDTGAFVDGDFLTALLAEALLAKEPGATILYDVRASRAVADTRRARRRHARS